MCSYTSLQASFTPAVLTGHLRLDPLWGRSCRAYNLHARPVDDCRSQLAAIQDELSQLSEQGLLRCPPEALHVSLGAFLSVREDDTNTKEALWAHHGDAWLQELTDHVRQVQPFTLTYRAIVVTDAAVIAVADYGHEVRAIRELLTALREGIGLAGNQPNIVHTSLFRFADPLRDPAALLDAAKRIPVDTGFRVDEVVVTRELLYPTLITEDLALLPLAD